MTTSFLSNTDLWRTITSRIKTANRVHAAIAYLGSSGSRLLPLSKGDHLVVDMSPSTVKAGATNPFEVEKLLKRGVNVFTRSNLHAKLVVVDNLLIAGSANVSLRSVDILDEAAIITSDRMAILRARDFIERLSTEPIRPKYLAQCKQQYKSPRIAKGSKLPKSASWLRTEHAKLWIVSLITGEIPEGEQAEFDKGERKAKKLLRNADHSQITDFHWPRKPKMADEFKLGDWVIQIIKDGNRIYVQPPAQYLYQHHFRRGKNKHNERWVFYFEDDIRGQEMSWSTFKRNYKRIFGQDLNRPKTKAIRDTMAADALLSLWTSTGRIAKRQRR